MLSSLRGRRRLPHPFYTRNRAAQGLRLPKIVCTDGKTSGRGRDGLRPTGLLHSLLATGLPGHFDQTQDLGIAGGSSGIENHAIAEILTEGLGKALAGVFHMNKDSFPDKYRGGACSLNSRGRYDAFLRSAMIFESEWCILVEPVLYAVHKKCQQKLCTTSKEEERVWRAVRAMELDRGISQRVSQVLDSPLSLQKRVTLCIPCCLQGRKVRKEMGEQERGRRQKTQPTGWWTVF